MRTKKSEGTKRYCNVEMVWRADTGSTDYFLSGFFA